MTMNRDDLKTRAARIVHLYAAGSAAVGACPIPGPDLPILISMQVKMILDIGRIYQPEMTTEEALLVNAMIGAGAFGLKEACRQLCKLVPGYGWAIAGSIAASGTEAFGWLAITHFEKQLETA